MALIVAAFVFALPSYSRAQDTSKDYLTPQEADQLFDTLRKLAGEGCTVLYISHKLNEIKALCESATILRGGRVVGECDPRVETQRRIAEMMIGAELANVERARGRTPGTARLIVERLGIVTASRSGTRQSTQTRGVTA